MGLTERIFGAGGPRLRRGLAIGAVVANAGIAVTGCVVRVTGSGLGCPAWPQCVPGSLTPVEHPELAQLHQWIEYGNRLVTVVVGLCVLTSWHTRRSLMLSLTIFAGVVAQAAIGGVTVLTGLLWWTVAVHLLVSAALVWLSVLLVDSIAEPQPPATRVHPASTMLLGAAVGVLAAVLVAGTLVTAAGPHAGDADAPRLGLPIEPLGHTHASLLFLLLGLMTGLGVVIRFVITEARAWRRYIVLSGLILTQGLFGLVQFWTGVPAILVTLHVLGAMTVTAAMAGLWCALRGQPSRARS